MKDSKSIFQITLFKAIIVIYLIYIALNSIFGNELFFHDNAQFGIWAIISFIIFSVFILTIDFIIISICKLFNEKYRRLYILFIQLVICVVVYHGLRYMFNNAEKING